MGYLNLFFKISTWKKNVSWQLCIVFKIKYDNSIITKIEIYVCYVQKKPLHVELHDLPRRYPYVRIAAHL